MSQDMYYALYALLYFLCIVAALISIFASIRVKSVYKRFRKQRAASGLTGAEVAQRILESEGIYDVTFKRVRGELTDYYDPRNRQIALSNDIGDGNSVAAVCIAAHECGHAIQHFVGYGPHSFRSALAPVSSIGSKLAWPIIFVGFLFNNSMGTMLLDVGVVMFALAVFFELVTLPVEFDASRRAIKKLDELGILAMEEQRGAKKVLNAAAMTYVAAAASAIIQLLRLLLIVNGRRRD